MKPLFNRFVTLLLVSSLLAYTCTNVLACPDVRMAMPVNWIVRFNVEALAPQGEVERSEFERTADIHFIRLIGSEILYRNLLKTSGEVSVAMTNVIAVSFVPTAGIEPFREIILLLIRMLDVRLLVASLLGALGFAVWGIIRHINKWRYWQERKLPPLQSLEPNVTHRPVPAPIDGGTWEEQERLEKIVLDNISLVPAWHVGALKSIVIDNDENNPSPFVTDGSANPTTNIVKINMLLRDDNEIKETLVHEIGHIAHFNVMKARTVWDRIRPQTLIPNALFVSMPLLTTVVGLFIGINQLPWLLPLPIMKPTQGDPALFAGMMILTILLTSGAIGNYVGEFLMKIGLHLNAPFITEYATRNPLEDFAESYREYVLRKGIFRNKAQKNTTLLLKYRAMQEIFGDTFDLDESGNPISKPPVLATDSHDLPVDQTLSAA